MTPRRSPHADARRALNDSVRTLYEDTLVLVREIARIAGVTKRNIHSLVRRLAFGGGRRMVPSHQKRRERAGDDKPKQRRGYQWRPIGAPPAWAE